MATQNWQSDARTAHARWAMQRARARWDAVKPPITPVDAEPPAVTEEQRAAIQEARRTEREYFEIVWPHTGS